MEQKARAFAEITCVDGRGCRFIQFEQLEDLGHLRVVQLENRCAAQRIFKNYARVERLAQIYIEDPYAIAASRGEKGMDGATGDSLPLRKSSETNRVSLGGKLFPLRSELEKVPCHRLVDDVLRLPIFQSYGD